MENAKKPDEKMYSNIANRITSTKTVINEIIAANLPWQPCSIERLVLGVGNEVYRLVNPENEDENTILRIHHGEHKGFYFEKWAMDEVKKHGAFVPEILSIGTKQFRDKILTYCFERELRGKSLSAMLDEGLSSSDMRRYAFLAGETLAKIHFTKTDGFGHFVENGIAEYATLKESIQQSIDDIKDLSKAVEELDFIENQTLHAAIEKIDSIKYFETSHLIHVDYAPKHIFISKGQITGVIDFEICMSGIAATDFNRWRAQDNRLPMINLIEGYKRIQKLPENFWESMLIIQIHSAIRTILYHFRVSQEMSEIKRAAQELVTLVKTNKSLID